MFTLWWNDIYWISSLLIVLPYRCITIWNYAHAVLGTPYVGKQQELIEGLIYIKYPEKMSWEWFYIENCNGQSWLIFSTEATMLMFSMQAVHGRRKLANWIMEKNGRCRDMKEKRGRKFTMIKDLKEMKLKKKTELFSTTSYFGVISKLMLYCVGTSYQPQQNYTSWVFHLAQFADHLGLFDLFDYR